MKFEDVCQYLSRGTMFVEKEKWGAIRADFINGFSCWFYETPEGTKASNNTGRYKSDVENFCVKYNITIEG